MKHDYIDQEQIIERYVMEKLRPDETEEFEQHFLHCARCQDEITFSENLVVGFSNANISDELEDSQRITPNLWQRYLKVATQPVYAAAATTLLAVAVTSNMVSWRLAANALDAQKDLVAQLAQTTRPQSNLPIMSLSPTRSMASAVPDNQLTLENEHKWVVMAMEIPPESGSTSYRVALRDANNITLWRDDNLMLDINREIVIGLYSSLFTKGVYSLQVESLKADDSWAAVGNYAFQVSLL